MVKANRTRRGFSPEFKLEAVRRVLERTARGVSIAQLGRELDVRPDLLRAWVRQAQERSGATATDVFPGHGRLPSDQEELRRLQRENARLQQELDFLKRAAAYFARESR
ncbi:MAG: transposase [Gemmatimonadota bacterium]|nr:transposase [Gemmatimonadota bacterium]